MLGRLIPSMSLGFLFLFPLSIHLSPTAADDSSDADRLQTYIVHVDRPAATSASSTLSSVDDLQAWYATFLPAATTTAASTGENHRLVYGYRNVLTGFAARYTEREFSELQDKPGFMYAYPDRILKLQTTRTPDFLGLKHDAPGLWNDSNYGQGIVIGMLDTGVMPNLPSFGDEGLPPPPAKWKGVCEFNASDCNNKIISARNFVKGLTSMTTSAGVMIPSADGPTDTDGHGTHTASTAAGMFVHNANVDGQANGTAAGMAPLAHLAIYKVCGTKNCASSDVLAGMDAAVEDGVDVMSLSIAGESEPFYREAVAIGAFGAMGKGILVSCAAGNTGPGYQTVDNDAPWLLTVGASTMDRSILATVELGNRVNFNGESAYQPTTFSSTMLPLVYPGFLGISDTYCSKDSFIDIDVEGKVVMCDDGNVERIEKGENVKKAGGAAMIIANNEDQGATTSSEPHVLPVSHVSYADGVTIKSYISSDPAPTAAITFNGTVIGTTPAPVVASFSSRGPSQADPNILKPDILGPGVNILAAWPFPYGSNTDTKFNIISGTSMATPHLSGIAALLKSAHTDWSPAAIKSALMTTAYTDANDGNPILDQSLNKADFFAIGSGHVDPTKASNPGLIYDISPDDYIAYLCGIPYTDQQVSFISRRPIKCSDTGRVSGPNLNYPSFMVTLTRRNKYRAVVGRTVTNVGAPSSTYRAQVTPPEGVTVTVSPKELVFAMANEKASYNVTFVANGGSSSEVAEYFQGYLTWVSLDTNVTVNSPIMVAVQ